MSETFGLEIYASNKLAYAGRAQKLIIPAVDGEQGFLAHHANVVAAIIPGEMRFEDAAGYRDLINSIRRIGERQKITTYGEEDRDIIAVAMDESEDLREQDAVVQVFFMRGGRLIGRDHFFLRVARGDTKAQVLSSFLKQFYAGTPFIPAEIMMQTEIEDGEIIEDWLTARRKQRVHIRVPKKGTKEKLVELAKENAWMVLSKDRERIKREEGRTIGAVKEIEDWLGLKDIVRMEAYDISNLGGSENVAGMVVFENGRPLKSAYRRKSGQKNGTGTEIAFLYREQNTAES